MATQKKTVTTPAATLAETMSPAMVRFDAAASVDFTTDAARKNNMEARGAATRELFLAGAAVFAEIKSFTPMDAISRYYRAAGQNMPEDRALVSRKTEWKSLKEAVDVAGLAKVEYIWPPKAEGEVTINRALFLKGVNMLKADKDLPADVVLARIREKSKGFRMPKFKGANSGDLLAVIIAASKALADVDARTYIGFQDELLGTSVKYQDARDKGALLTSGELEELAAKSDETKPGGLVRLDPAALAA
jgi:hypothetical protein